MIVLVVSSYDKRRFVLSENGWLRGEILVHLAQANIDRREYETTDRV